jgi:hypothetical protein
MDQIAPVRSDVKTNFTFYFFVCLFYFAGVVFGAPRHVPNPALGEHSMACRVMY